MKLINSDQSLEMIKWKSILDIKESVCVIFGFCLVLNLGYS